MKKFILALVALFALGIAANAANYSADEASIDALVAEAVEIAPMSGESASAASEYGVANPDPIIAFVLSTFVGWCGLHRVYMGCGHYTWLIYLCTSIVFVGLIVDFIDWVQLLVKIVKGESCGEFAGNEKWLMWM